MQKHNKQTKKALDPPAVTIGIDLGDKVSHYCLLDEAGQVAAAGNVLNSEASLRKHFAHLPPARIALEAGARTHWWTRQLESFGHQVLVAHARAFAPPKNVRKNDRNDAERLARYARLDPQLLHPVTLRSAEQQRDLLPIRIRQALLRQRTQLVNLVRSIAKEHALRLPASLTRHFGQRSCDRLPAELRSLLLPLLTLIDTLTLQLEQQDEQIETLALEKYPETRYLRSIAGVGTLTALTYVLTLGSPTRFRHSREAGAYLGLRPAQRQSGESDPQLGISKQGNRYLRSLLVQCAQHILGPFGKPSALREWGRQLSARGGGNAKKRAVVAVARKLAVLLHRLWTDRQYYQPYFAQPVDPRTAAPAHVL